MFGTLRKDPSLIDNITERSVRYVYRITQVVVHPPIYQ